MEFWSIYITLGLFNFFNMWFFSTIEERMIRKLSLWIITMIRKHFKDIYQEGKHIAIALQISTLDSYKTNSRWQGLGHFGF